METFLSNIKLPNFSNIPTTLSNYTHAQMKVDFVYDVRLCKSGYFPDSFPFEPHRTCFRTFWISKCSKKFNVRELQCSNSFRIVPFCHFRSPPKKTVLRLFQAGFQILVTSTGLIKSAEPINYFSKIFD